MIYFVGAGSGAKDLITVRGAQLLQEADMIIYAGSLVNPQLLEYAKSSCRIYDSARLTLEEVAGLMLDAEKQRLVTVRLHTGDPCLYGAIREQMDLLSDHGVEYTVVPGVSSFCGAAAALKAEYTLPDVSQSVIITRMAGRTPVPPQEDLRLLAAHGSTMVIFLSMGQISQMAAELLAGGAYTEDTPAAIVYKATWPEEKVYYCTIGTLQKTAEEHHITKTALVTVGDFLGNQYQRSKLYDPAFTTEFRQAKTSESEKPDLSGETR